MAESGVTMDTSGRSITLERQDQVLADTAKKLAQGAVDARGSASAESDRGFLQGAQMGSDRAPIQSAAYVDGDGDDMFVGGSGDDSAYGGSGSDLFLFDDGSGTNYFDGGAGGGWTDVVQVDFGPLDAGDSPWSLVIDDEQAQFDLAAGALELSPDTSGVITMGDGSQLAFEGVERIEWT